MPEMSMARARETSAVDVPDQAERRELDLCKREEEDRQRNGRPEDEARAFARSWVLQPLVHVAVREEGHGHERRCYAGAVVPPETLVELADGFDLVCLAQVFDVGIGAVVPDDEFGERGGGEDVRQHERQVAGAPDGAGQPVPTDGVHTMVVDLEVHSLEGEGLDEPQDALA
ncbi:hypothetical protein A1O7_07317 [Cladophialophora yegresii CBS 114405]|uniref:Uncharacterized protein n=1 Tax=Cladophialophora yegresii CBS 114405 TaxID=1182544 RepID=W9VN69_9EURO|nr:uncharacterized protein A1O7_07317 [Cladophialophora yegresii CBS 114405]EXJ56973.1 hypothetical protein A1O7_07317 [Cladophialophora yegresii CBS 114405]